MEKYIFEMLYEEVLFEFANRFGKNAVHAWYLSQALIPDENVIKEFLEREFKGKATDDNIRFLKGHIRAQRSLEQCCKYMAGAMGMTLKQFIGRERNFAVAMAKLEQKHGE
jgi:hypothetical protein